MEKSPFDRLYVKMTLYFLSTILVTLICVAAIFYVTVGKPLMREIHDMLRSHTRYVGEMVTGLMEKKASQAEINHFIDQFKKSYGFSVAVTDRQGSIDFSSQDLQGKRVPLTEKMITAVAEKGIFVQSSHFSRPLIYLTPIDFNGEDRPRYLFVTHPFPSSREDVAFLMGILVVGLILALAAYPLSKGITRPVSDLSNALKEMTEGRFDTMPECARKDEIGDLFRTFRDMSQSVNRLIHSKRQLLADISHELCSPLGRIRVGTELLKEITDSDRSKRYLTNIERDIHSMDLLIGNLSLFSRMNLPGFTLSLERISPDMLVSNIHEHYLPVVEKSGIHLEVRTDPRLPDTLLDFERLKQVFTNLVDNALRYSEANQTIEIGARQEGRWIVFFVSDQGPGVPEKDAERIFEPLYRVDPSRNREKGGTGLGLAIAKKIVEHHGGELVYKRENNRTIFSFFIESGVS